jgi:hypothetical protein
VISAVVIKGVEAAALVISIDGHAADRTAVLPQPKQASISQKKCFFIVAPV